MTSEVDAARGENQLAVVATVCTWAIVVPILNVLVPLYFQAWNELSSVAFFGQIPSAAALDAQLWKLYVARGVSVFGVAVIALFIGLLKRAGVKRANLWVGFVTSSGLTFLWFAVNGGWFS
ncbi:hypothetical protein ACFQ9V_10470 [Leifsonia sp. NPDC056665]|uniref:hypothetical protein n=1 Tax=Leifsonia sp. NPDC056665 TaxID=3345901 RepID=UPI0036796B70